MIIEDLEELKNICKGTNIYVEIFTENDNYHPKLVDLVAVTVGTASGIYIVPIDHPDGIGLPIGEVQKCLKESISIFVYDKKLFLYFFNCKNVIDLTLIGLVPEENFKKNSTYFSYLRKYENYKQLNKVYPLLKLLEKSRDNFCNIQKSLGKLKLPKDMEFFNNIAIPVYYLLEQHGLKVDNPSFIEHYTPNNPQYSITSQDIVYTWYNPYNITSRPTNAFNSINFAAIPKKQEYRECIEAQFDYFVEFDFDGYHLRLLGEQIGYTFTQDSAHRELAKMYFKKDDITEEEYGHSKQLNFQALYGKLTPEQKEITFFIKLEKYVQDLWEEFRTKGYVNAPISKKMFTQDLCTDMNPKKLLNYIIQALETARNVLVLQKALKYLIDKQSKIALYTYDSILLDFKKEDGKEVLYNLESILSEEGKYPLKIKYGTDLTFKN